MWELPFGLVCRLQYMKGFTGGEQNLKASMSKKGGIGPLCPLCPLIIVAKSERLKHQLT